MKTPDWARFEGQAMSILSGDGFQTNGVGETRLPPGYPFFIALVYRLGGDETVVLVLQLLMILASCGLVFLAIEPFGKWLAIAGTLTMAVHPFIARFASYYLSEVLGIFFCSIYVYCLSQSVRDGSNRICYLLLGVVAIALPLISPATIILTFLCSLYVLVKKGDCYSKLFLMLGAFLVLAPWQAHCIKSTGAICPALYSSDILEKRSVWYPWLKSWSTTQSDLHFFWHHEDLPQAPDRAFDTNEQRAELISAQQNDPDVFERLLREIAANRIESDPINYHVTLPLVRSFNLWFDMNQLSHIQMEYVGRMLPTRTVEEAKEIGWPRALKRLAKGFLSTLVYFHYILFPILLLVAMAFSIRQKLLLPTAIVLSILIYTLISGYTAHIEARRNLVFIPVMVFLLAWWPRWSRSFAHDT